MSEQPEKALKILAVEDEPMVRMFIRRSLGDLGHEVVDVVPSAEACMKVIKKQAVELVLMDINISGKVDGIEAADVIQREMGIPVIFLTANSDNSTVHRAVRTRPFGYVIKPFDKNDLHAAISVAVAQVSLQKKDDILDMGYGYAYNLDKRKLTHNGQVQVLARKELLLLHILIENEGEVVLYDDIKDFVWRMDEVFNHHSLRDLVYRLRKRIPEYKIVTVPGVGIQLRLNKKSAD